MLLRIANDKQPKRRAKTLVLMNMVPARGQEVKFGEAQPFLEMQMSTQTESKMLIIYLYLIEY